MDCRLVTSTSNQRAPMSSPAFSRSKMHTEAPFSASSRAAAHPIPFAPPVTTASLPLTISEEELRAELNVAGRAHPADLAEGALSKRGVEVRPIPVVDGVERL